MDERHNAKLKTHDGANCPKIVFCGEQDGFAERELKIALKHVLCHSKTLRRAYLAQVRLDEREKTAALCLRTEPNYEDGELVRQAVEVFQKLFLASEKLDVFMLSDEQERVLAKCCRPFMDVVIKP